MLQKLTVKNYAIIDHIEILFSGQLNIITGETGAGKSILLGALSLALGDRADNRALFNEKEKCVVEAVFNISSYGLEPFFHENDLDYEDNTVIRREINSSGKSRSFINDTPVNLNLLKSLGSQLVNLHSQHETLELSSSSFQLQLVDAVAGNDGVMKDYQEIWQKYKASQKELETLQENLRRTAGDLDYLNYQFRELDEAGLNNEEHEMMEQELKVLENAEEIKAGIQKASDLLNEDPGIISALNEATQLLSHLQKYSPDSGKLLERVESVVIELQDVAREMTAIGDDTVYDEQRIQLLVSRLNTVNKLLLKHKVQQVKELLGIREDIKSRIDASAHSQELIKELELRLAGLRKDMEKLMATLTRTRKAVLTKIETEVGSRLTYVGMPHARLAIVMDQLPFEKLNQYGWDKIRFLFTANKGRDPEELKHIASGGELSRLMLVLKSLIAANTALPTLIFDEIDAGISGEVAHKVGLVLEQLGKAHQVIAITHLPQIASKGKTHFFTYKDQHKGQTITRIKQLNEKERIAEIAKMLGGDKITDAAMENAKELLFSA